MGNYVCRDVLYNGFSRVNCSYESIFNDVSKLVKIDSPVTDILLSVEALLLFAFWSCTLSMKRDFTKSFLMSVCLLLTGEVAFRGANRLIEMFDPYMLPYNAKQTILGYGIICNQAGRYAFAAGSILYAIFALRTACSRTQMPHGAFTCVPFLLIAAAATALSFLTYMPYVPLYKLRQVFFVLGVAPICFVKFIFMSTTFSWCCCKPKPNMPLDDPVVWNAKSRYFWCIPLLCSATLACAFDIFKAVLSAFNPTSMDYNMQSYFVDTNNVILIAIFLFLPAYRSKLFFGCCIDTQTASNKIVPVTAEQLKPVQNEPAPMQAMPAHLPMYHSMSVPPTANFPVIHSYGAPAPPPFHHQPHQHHVYAMPNYAVPNYAAHHPNPIVIG